MSLHTPVRPAPTPDAVEPTAPAKRPPFAWVADLVDLTIAVIKPTSIPLLRIALGVVYLWFGVLKVIGATPVGDLVAAMMPFLPANVAVTGMGIVEVILGGLLIAGVLVPWVAAVQIAHLLGTFAVFVIYPAVVFTGNPLFVTFEGEFIAKNLVLIAGLLVVAGYSTAHAKRR
ncbi:putative oxidoreductase [Microbacteriaceae bacterium SG_E_30_P1]|uniref:Oxidoreductase n=1 Tax=Antiquaquibacter oligotrophicus TaxID=2880260 RepID=A0ABT6KLW5_9MICO|nr:DoxX family protein [Antiquaquibacter oligotrophicus]MDH6180980.1 putative oxidoreductase [Antiquaquibacter oligotrophicus]UDF13320.1 DoxX family protein [Antiquaquibacter oligotrophicus]